MYNSSKPSPQFFRRPNLFLIGGMRCGSTTLNMLLEQHPEVYMSPVKEPYFYCAETQRRVVNPNISELSILREFENGGKHRTVESYASLFSGALGEPIIGEASHYLYHPSVAQTIINDCPEARVIVVLRDPVERLHSEYLYMKRSELEERDFSRFVRDFVNKSNMKLGQSHVPKLNKGLQGKLLAPWIECFGRRRIKIVLFEELASNPKKVISSIYAWLGVDSEFQPIMVHAEKGGVRKSVNLVQFINSRGRTSQIIKRYILPKLLKERIRQIIYSSTLERPEIDPQTRQFLENFYQKDVRQLAKLIGRELPGWLETDKSIF